MFFFNRFQPQPAERRPYSRVLRCYSVAFNVETHADIAEVNSGGKIFLPQSALEYLCLPFRPLQPTRFHNSFSCISHISRTVQQQISYPMHFMVRAPRTGRHTHCGVLEFTAPEGRCYLPLWMMRQIGAEDGDAVEVAYTVLPLGRGVRLQPCTRDFLDLSDHRAVLEVMMTKYAALTVGDVFLFHYNRRDYHLEVRDVVPHNAQNAINIVETNLAIEFDPPKDMPPEPAASDASAASASQASLPSSSSSKPKKASKKGKTHKRRRDEALGSSDDAVDTAAVSSEEPEPAAAAAAGGDAHRFVAFAGVGHTLSSSAPATAATSATAAAAAAPAARHADSGTVFVPFAGTAHTLSGHSAAPARNSRPAAAETPMFGRSELPTAASQQQSQRPPSCGYVAFGGEGHRLG